MVGFLGRLSYELVGTPVTPLFAKHLGAPDQYIGLLVAAVTLTGVVIKSPAGGLSDLFGYRRLMVVGSFVDGIGPFLYLLVVSWPVLLLVRLYHGLATAIYAPPASALVADLYPRERGFRLGLYNSAENAGIVLGPVLAGVLITITDANFFLIFVISGIIGVLSFAAMLKVPEIAHRGPSSSHPIRKMFVIIVGDLWKIATNTQIRLISLVEAALWMGIGSIQAYLPLFALTLHLPVWQIGLLSGVQGIVSVGSRPSMGRHSDRLSSRKWTIALGSLLCITLLIAIPYAKTFYELLALCALFGLGTGTVTPSTMAMIGDLAAGGNLGSAMGVFGSLWDIGHAVGPIAFGFLLVAFDYKVSWLAMALIMGIALALFLAGTVRQTPVAQGDAQ